MKFDGVVAMTAPLMFGARSRSQSTSARMLIQCIPGMATLACV